MYKLRLKYNPMYHINIISSSKFQSITVIRYVNIFIYKIIEFQQVNNY
jgi:predicted metallopeptidase